MPVCEYGTRAKATAPVAFYVTSDSVAGWVQGASDWLADVLNLIGRELIVTSTF